MPVVIDHPIVLTTCWIDVAFRCVPLRLPVTQSIWDRASCILANALKPVEACRGEIIAASKTWRRTKGANQLPKLIAGARFNDGIEVIRRPANHAA